MLSSDALDKVQLINKDVDLQREKADRYKNWYPNYFNIIFRYFSQSFKFLLCSGQTSVSLLNTVKRFLKELTSPP
jgi:hypothetical protein